MTRIALSLILGAAAAVTLVRSWILPLGDSFWIDEAGIVFAIQDGWARLVERAFDHPTSFLYLAVVFAFRQVAGGAEWVARLPSLLGMGAAMAVLAAFVRRRLGPGLAAPVLVFALVSPEMQFYGAETRPYALCLLLMALSVLFLVRLHESFAWAPAVSWAVTTGLCIQLHPASAFALVGQAAWVLFAGRNRPLFPWLGPLLLAAAVAAPDILRLTLMATKGSEINSIPPPTLASVLGFLFPRSILGPTVVALAATLLLAGKPDGKLPARRWLALAAALAFAPVLAATAVSSLTPFQFLLTRYVLSVWLGWFLLLACLLAAWSSPRARLVFTTAYAVSTLAASVFVQGPRLNHGDVDWRGALAAVREWENGRHLPLLVQTGFIEGSFQHHLTTPRLHDFLIAPALVYPHPGPTYALPFRDDPALEPYLEQTAARVRGQPFAVLVYEDAGTTSSHKRYLAARFGEPRFLGRFRRVSLYAFDRSRSSDSER